MVYRKPGSITHEPPIVVRYGFLSLPLGSLGFGVLLLAVGLFMGFSTARDHVHCERLGEDDGTCSVSSDFIVMRHHRYTFHISTIREVRWVPYGDDMGKTELIDEVGRSFYLANCGRSDARALYEEISEFFDNLEQPSLDVIEPLSTVPLVIAMCCFAGFGLALISMFRSTTSIRLVIDREAQTMSIRRQHFGFPGSKSSLTLKDVESVEVERSTIVLWYQQKHQKGKPAGRIVLVQEKGGRQTITEDYLLGKEVHERTAEKLRELLFIHSDEVEPTEEETTGLTSKVTSFFATLFHSPGWDWFKNKRHLAIVGGLAAAVSAPSLYFYISERLDTERGTLEVRCVHRCRMGEGWVCLPGGAWQSSMKAGSYTIEVWNPDRPDQWEPVTVEVIKGQHTLFVCRPPRGD